MYTKNLLSCLSDNNTKCMIFCLLVYIYIHMYIYIYIYIYNFLFCFVLLHPKIQFLKVKALNEVIKELIDLRAF